MKSGQRAKHLTLTLALVAVGVSTGACASPAPRPPTVTLKDAEKRPAYVIGPGDVIEIAVWKNPAVSRTVPVLPDGTLSLPLVNDLMAAGLTPMQLRTAVTGRLSRYIPDVEVSVIVREIHSAKVSVFGNVAQPGRYDINIPMHVLDLLAHAGGLSAFATGDAVILRPLPDGGVRRITVAVIPAMSNQAKNPYLASGDVVFVP